VGRARYSVLTSMSRASAPFLAVLYLAFGVADLLFSLTAFQLGVPEGNPFLKWMQAQGLFVPAKLGVTVIAAGLMVWLHSLRRAQVICWFALVGMALVNIYHFIFLNARLAAG